MGRGCSCLIGVDNVSVRMRGEGNPSPTRTVLSLLSLMVPTCFVEETNCGYSVLLVLLDVTYDIQLITLSNFILSLFHYWTKGPSWFFGVLS